MYKIVIPQKDPVTSISKTIELNFLLSCRITRDFREDTHHPGAQTGRGRGALPRASEDRRHLQLHTEQRSGYTPSDFVGKRIWSSRRSPAMGSQQSRSSTGKPGRPQPRFQKKERYRNALWFNNCQEIREKGICKYFRNAIKNVVIRERWNPPTGKLGKTFATLIGGSLASKTWKKYASAWNMWEGFMASEGWKDWNFTQEKSWGFICWCKKNRKLKAETVKQYLTVIGKISDLLSILRGSQSSIKINRETDLKKILLTGYKNMEKGREKPVAIRPINLSILQKIRVYLYNKKISRGVSHRHRGGRM